MNKKVFVSMLVLVVAFLAGLYIAKIFFPAEFMMNVQNETLVKIGLFIDTHKWAYYLFGTLTSFLTYWLYCCAVCSRTYLKWYECLAILIVIAGSVGLIFVDASLVVHYNICTMLLLPLIFGGDLKHVAITYGIHGFAQILSLRIRDLPMYMIGVNSLTLFLMNIECLFWLMLFYIVFNYKKKEN